MNKLVDIVMGSKSDYKIMKDAENVLDNFGIEYNTKIISAHRTPDRLYDYAKSTNAKVIIAGAGGAAHLPGILASHVLVPVLGVPIGLKYLKGIDSLLSIIQMPEGIPVGTLSIDGAKNAAILSVQILSLSDSNIRNSFNKYRDELTLSVPYTVED